MGHEGFRFVAEHCAANDAGHLLPQPQQIAMHGHDLGVRLAFAVIELASLECVDVVRSRELTIDCVE